jgi:type IV secretory pathway VirB10-like protein
VSDEKQSLELSEPHPSPQAPSVPALRDKRSVPEGVVPKQAQGYVVAGLAVLILLAVMFSKNHAKIAPGAPPNPASFSNDANARRIAELEQNLSAEQRQSQQQGQQQIQKPGGTAGAPANSAVVQAGGSVAPAAQSSSAAEPPRDPVADAERAIAFKSRFASNLVSADAGTPRPSASAADSADAIVRPRVNDDATTPNPDSRQVPSSSSEQKRAPEVSVNAAHGQPYVLFEGTTIDTTLLNRLNGDFSGPVKVMVTNSIYSHDNQHVLIPEGTFLLGDVQKVSDLGHRRLAVTFHRMIMPDGYSVDLDKFHGLNQIGETGLNDKVNSHYIEIFGTSIALGVIAGAAESTTNSGFNESGSDAIRQGMASSLSASAAHVLDRFMNVLPTITINEGHRIKVYLTQDLLLPAYENHSIPGDI